MEDYPYLNPEHIPQDIHVSIPLSDRERVNTKRAPKHIDHVFDIDIANMILTEEQQHVMDNILQNSHRLHILTGTPGSGKTFFVKYIAQYFQKHNKKVTLSATTGAAVLRLSKSASTIHTVFRIPTHGYLSMLPKPSPVLTKLNNANVIIIDEMSMMTSNMLCAVEQRIKQNTLITDTFSFQNKLLILVGDLAQMLAICIHKLKISDIICKTCHITSAPC